MGQDTKIEWCHHSWSPWWGCQKVSDGCKFCYAESLDGRYNAKDPHWGPSAPRKTMSEAHWKEPLKWNRKAETEGVRYRVFPSMCDVFEVRDELHELRARLFDLIRQTPHLDWLLLTKRPENILPAIDVACRYACEIATTGLAGWLGNWLDGSPPPNVWAGTSVENQAAADERIPHLLKVPAAVRFLSMEPLLGEVDLRRWAEEGLECSECAWRGCEQQSPGQRTYEDFPEDEEYECPKCGAACAHTPLNELLGDGIHWAIVGCESGPNRRPFNLDHARQIKEQCAAAGVAYFGKQMLIDGKVSHDMNEWPEDLRVREFPKVEVMA